MRFSGDNVGCRLAAIHRVFEMQLDAALVSGEVPAFLHAPLKDAGYRLWTAIVNFERCGVSG